MPRHVVDVHDVAGARADTEADFDGLPLTSATKLILRPMARSLVISLPATLTVNAAIGRPALKTMPSVVPPPMSAHATPSCLKLSGTVTDADANGSE